MARKAPLTRRPHVDRRAPGACPFIPCPAPTSHRDEPPQAEPHRTSTPSSEGMAEGPGSSRTSPRALPPFPCRPRPTSAPSHVPSPSPRWSPRPLLRWPCYETKETHLSPWRAFGPRPHLDPAGPALAADAPLRPRALCPRLPGPPGLRHRPACCCAGTCLRASCASRRGEHGGPCRGPRRRGHPCP